MLSKMSLNINSPYYGLFHSGEDEISQNNLLKCVLLEQVREQIMFIRNEDIKVVLAEIQDAHNHLRTTLCL
jgi:hypothetical protein